MGPRFYESSLSVRLVALLIWPPIGKIGTIGDLAGWLSMNVDLAFMFLISNSVKKSLSNYFFTLKPHIKARNPLSENV